MVCSVDDPRDLPGVHAHLVSSALLPAERLRHLLYSPIWDGESAHFDVRGEPASHGVAVTDSRLLISRDFHRRGRPPALFSVPFEHILYVELGTALLLGWFAIRFAAGGRLASVCLLFEATVGAEHFSSAVRAFRAAVGSRCRPHGGRACIPWSEVWNRVTPYQARNLAPLLFDGERPIAAIGSRLSWGLRRRFLGRAPVRVADDGTLVVTDLGVLYVMTEPDIRPDLWSFGVNVWTVPHDAIRCAAIVGAASRWRPLRRVRLTLARNQVTTAIEVPFDETCAESASGLVRILGEGPAR